MYFNLKTRNKYIQNFNRLISQLKIPLNNLKKQKLNKRIFLSPNLKKTFHGNIVVAPKHHNSVILTERNNLNLKFDHICQ